MSNSTQSNFEKIVEFHKAFGLDYNTSPQLHVVRNNPKLVNLRVKLIDEEFSELLEAIENHDFVEVIDALTDLLYVAYGACASFGINANSAYKVYDKVNFKIRQNVTKEDPNLISLMISDIQSQITFFHKAVANGNDFYNVKKSLFGILRATYRACINFGINPNQSFALVHNSNMTKLCETEELAQQTVETYKNDPEKRYPDPQYRKSDDGKYFVVYNAADNKILKSDNYKPVSFESMLPEIDPDEQMANRSLGKGLGK